MKEAVVLMRFLRHDPVGQRFGVAALVVAWLALAWTQRGSCRRCHSAARRLGSRRRGARTSDHRRRSRRSVLREPLDRLGELGRGYNPQHGDRAEQQRVACEREQVGEIERERRARRS